MSLLSIDDWQSFLFKTGENFYELVHGESDLNDEYTKVEYPYVLSYRGATLVPLQSGSSQSMHTATCYFNLDSWSAPVMTDFVLDDKHSNYTGYYAEQYLTDNLIYDYNFSISCLDSWVSNNNMYNPYWIATDHYIKKLNAAGTQYYSDIFKYVVDYNYYNNSSHSQLSNISVNQTGSLKVDFKTVSRYYNDSTGYYIYSSQPNSLLTQNFQPNSYIPACLSESPVFIDSSRVNTSFNLNTTIQNIYTNNGDTINTYTYNIDNNNYIDVTYSIDSDGVPSGYVDINPTGEISFDDLFDMFNTILAPLVGVGLDLPDWTDYQPPVVTGDINVNIDLPDVTGEYPSETITPIESDVYNIISIDSMPQLPSLTGIDNGESAAVLGSSFTFLDGCGLLMPFVTIAIIRLLISKFRGDS